MAHRTLGLHSKALNLQMRSGRTLVSEQMTRQCFGLMSGEEKTRHIRLHQACNGSDLAKWVIKTMSNSVVIHKYLVQLENQDLMVFLKMPLEIAGSSQLLRQYQKFRRESTGSYGTNTTTLKEPSGITSGSKMAGMESISTIGYQWKALTHGQHGHHPKVLGGCLFLRRPMRS